jgi:hypothetical protein
VDKAKLAVLRMGAAVLAIGALAAGRPAPAHAAQLQSAAQCAAGLRVTTRDGHRGVITRVDREWSWCWVRQDDTGNEVEYLPSYLDSGGGAGNAGGGGGGGAASLPAGVYECMGNGTSYAGTLRVTGPGSYNLDGQPGRFTIGGNGQMAFSGPLRGMHGKLLSYGRIGLNANGDDSFYATACDLNRSLR